MKDSHLTYNGSVKAVTTSEKVKCKKYINWKAFCVWGIGLLVAIVPIFIDGVVYLKDHKNIDYLFLLQLCLKVDLLWIAATMLVTTIIDNFLSKDRSKAKWLPIVGLLLWSCDLLLWAVFKYAYPENYSNSTPIILNLIFFGLSVLACTAIEIKLVSYIKEADDE